MQKGIKTVFVGISLLLFVSSLTQTAYCINRSQDDCVSALMALLLGWLMPFDAGIAWYATPLLVAAWVFLFRNVKRAMVLSLFSLLLALFFLLFRTIVSNEAGTKYNIVSRNAGYWLWLSSIISFLILTGGLSLYNDIKGRAKK